MFALFSRYNNVFVSELAPVIVEPTICNFLSGLSVPIPTLPLPLMAKKSLEPAAFLTYIAKSALEEPASNNKPDCVPEPTLLFI